MQRRQNQPTLSFRIPKAFSNEVNRLADEMGISPHMYARQRLIASLSQTELRRVEDRLTELDQKVEDLQLDLRQFMTQFHNAVANILAYGGKMSVDSAYNWVRAATANDVETEH
ncbi:MAG: hypothetical protein KDB27_15825 [Planctomycetales bacterium]|nr:hypothetical protein [Planctomycetales bacterium]